jgi:hypothetical protein
MASKKAPAAKARSQSPKAAAAALQSAKDQKQADNDASMALVPTAFALPDNMKLTRVRALVRPFLLIKNKGDGRLLLFRGAMELVQLKGRDADNKVAKGGKPREPATVCDVVDMQTGEEFRYILGAVVVSSLKDTYPDNEFVGKSFLIINKGKRRPEQEYVDFQVDEVLVESK